MGKADKIFGIRAFALETKQKRRFRNESSPICQSQFRGAG
jgi:hypothetical protein